MLARIESSEKHPIINQAPVKVLIVFVIGSGENGELGTGPNFTSGLRPHRNPFLGQEDASGFHVVQVACGGMHIIALTRDDKIVTWGFSDHDALRRDSGLRDADADAGSDNGHLNPFESTLRISRRSVFRPARSLFRLLPAIVAVLRLPTVASSTDGVRSDYAIPLVGSRITTPPRIS